MSHYDVIVPVDSANLRRAGREKTAALLHKAGIKRILLSIGAYQGTDELRKRQLDALRENIGYMKGEGFEVGVWLWAFMCRERVSFTRITGFDGRVAPSSCCPLDEAFREFAAGYIKEIAGMKPSLILFDDDLRLGHLDSIGLGCFCDGHIADISDRLGEKISREALAAAVLTGEGNPIRSARMTSMGDSIRGFARKMREAVDSVDKSIRMGQCACITTFDADGVDSAELSRILAGDTKPYLRLIGAPYWAVGKSWGNRLADVIELERLERTWCGDGIEIVSEGDVYPRPRWITPASFLECFDTALRADGSLDGIQKYMLDYTSSSDYEPGYIKRHMKHRELYSQIDELFGGKEPVGVRVWAAQHKLESAKLPSSPDVDRVQDLIFSSDMRMAAENGISTVFTGCRTGMAFGENARHLPEDALFAGLVIDLTAAEILAGMGVDVGIESFGERFSPTEEYFIAENDTVVCSGVSAGRITVNEQACAKSRFGSADGDTPAMFTYTNRKGQRFAVLNADLTAKDERFRRNYLRQKQLISALEWLSGKPLPAAAPGNPDLYLLCKEGGGRLAVGLWNLSCDSIEPLTVDLGFEAESVRFLNCSGRAEGRRVTIDKLCPFEFAAVEAARL